jgi:sugar transferase (PEP-CTERM system associated)
MGSFFLGTLILYGPDSLVVLGVEHGFSKILAVTLIVFVFAYYFDLYDPRQLSSTTEIYFRLLVVLSAISLLLAAVGFIAPTFLFGKNVFLLGILIVTAGLLVWRSAYSWLISKPFLRERVYVIGDGPRAHRLVAAIRERPDLPVEIIGWKQNGCEETREHLAHGLAELKSRPRVDRVVIALKNRRGTLPVRELLDLRLTGVQVEEATSLLERISGKLEVDELYPSGLIFTDGFRLNQAALLLRRTVSIIVSLSTLLIMLPLIPFIVLAIKIDSPGPVLFRQERVGRNGQPFRLYKFRSMRTDAESESGPVWAADDDPRITRVGRFLRITRLDEIPQLWNVLRGDMGFVGPRPERPEFVQWLSDAIPYFHLRHIVRPGITGWAQVKYEYGNSLEDSKEKLKYDLYYIKHMSLTFDLLIMFKTVKTILFAQGR